MHLENTLHSIADISHSWLIELGILQPGGEECDFSLLATQHGTPQLERPAAEDIVVVHRRQMPHAFFNLALQLTGGPAGVPGKNPQVPIRARDDLNRGVQVHQADRLEERPPTRWLLTVGSHARQANGAIRRSGPAVKEHLRLRYGTHPVR